MKRLFFLCFILFFLFTSNIFAQVRIVSLAPASTEILFAIGAGDEIVARTEACDYPPEVKNIPALGGFDGKTFSIEAIIALKPDFVYAYKGMHDHLVEPLEKFGVQVFVSDVHSVQDIIDEIRSVGVLVGHGVESKLTASRMQKELIALQQKAITQQKKSIYWEVWYDPYMSASKNSFIGDIITLIGKENIFADSTQEYPIVSDESILARNPDIILYADDAPITADAITKRTGWHLLDAVKNKNIYAIDADTLTRPAPRILQAIEELANILETETQ